jgi:hypothetical protein
MALGEADTLARRDEVMQFFGWDAAHRAQRLAREAARAGEPLVDFDISRPMPDFELP